MENFTALQTFDDVDQTQKSQEEKSVELAETVDATEEEDSRHVDYFIEMGSRFNGGEKPSENEELSERYARFVLALHRFPACMRMDFDALIRKFPLFCTYQGAVYRVTGCSRLGDVWLTEKLDDKYAGYSKRVMIGDCSKWSNHKEYEHNYAPRFFKKDTMMLCLTEAQLQVNAY